MAMGMFMIFPMMLMAGGGGGANELLDFVQTDYYWQQRSIRVNVDNMVGQITTVEKPGDISELIKRLGSESFSVREEATAEIAKMGPSVIPQLEKALESDDAEVVSRARGLIKTLSGGQMDKQLNKLMVIRTLGELKDEKALPALKPLTESKEPFVARYAARAIASIKGEEYKPKGVTDATWESDLWMLPKDCNVVAQARAEGGGVFDYKAMFKQMGAMMAGQNQDQMIAQANSQMLKIANKVGNVRIDGATLGIVGNPDGNGYVVLIVRGMYDRQRVAEALKEEGEATIKEKDGVLIVSSPRDDMSGLLPSNNQLILVGGENGAGLPIDAVLATLKAGKGELQKNEKMVGLIKSIKDRSQMWAAVEMHESYREAEWMAPFDTVTAWRTTAKDSDGQPTMSFTVIGKGDDAEAVGKAVATMNEGLTQAREQMKQMQGVMPKSMVDFMNSIKIESEAGKASITAQAKGDVMAMGLAWPMMMFGARF